MIWAMIAAMGLTTLVLTSGPPLVDAIWPAAAEDRAAAELHKSRWNAGMELMASDDPASWQRIVDADRFRQDTAPAVTDCRNRANATKRPVRCLIEIAPAAQTPKKLLR